MNKQKLQQIISILDSMIEITSKTMIQQGDLNIVLIHTDENKQISRKFSILDTFYFINSDNLFLKVLITYVNQSGMIENSDFLLLLLFLRNFYIENNDNQLKTFDYYIDYVQDLLEKQFDAFAQQFNIELLLNEFSTLNIAFQNLFKSSLLSNILRPKHIKSLKICLLKTIVHIIENNSDSFLKQRDFTSYFQYKNNFACNDKNLFQEKNVINIFNGIFIELSNYVSETESNINLQNIDVFICLQSLDFDLKNLLEYGDHLKIQTQETDSIELQSQLTYQYIKKKINQLFNDFGIKNGKFRVGFFQKRVSQEFKSLFKKYGVYVFDCIGELDVRRLQYGYNIKAYPTLIEMQIQHLNEPQSEEAQYFVKVNKIQIMSDTKSTRQYLFLESNKFYQVFICEEILLCDVYEEFKNFINGYIKLIQDLYQGEHLIQNKGIFSYLKFAKLIVDEISKIQNQDFKSKAKFNQYFANSIIQYCKIFQKMNNEVFEFRELSLFCSDISGELQKMIEQVDYGNLSDTNLIKKSSFQSRLKQIFLVLQTLTKFVF
ncbi:hypothetical protein TTHERM_00248350 (macronuclear) [Tetrahymena thermophila SB210]|uniref:Uncharacterized protein n=1 Tax=Tetrahymena thermophila (strain SB210) TaxID=312017 RepID=Q245L3_TETTS|nr:hypothetical protein TTHERM_00248350 [Tetrahymena thermophila SB210]EAS03620.2 hypothetical protein TTHERM_00248350 [Tetrahymena thermophila SB210]|eukprot:XP_001023865.2 hypothetical protein TTHERM_00248350 [Tetrahymena thermophila SB210]